MTYTLQEQYNSKNMVAGSAADSVWHLGARRVTSITIHHWGLKGQQFDTVRDFLCTNNTPTSAHYVVQDGLVACIVSPDDCAFHAGNAEGNTFSVGIECRPEATDGDYATIAELIRFLRGIYGDIPLYPHNHWYNTACPGDYDLGRLDSLARGTTITTQSATITQEDDLTPDQAAQLAYIASPDFKRDIFTGASEKERAARAAFHTEALNTEVEWFGFDGQTQPAGQRHTTTQALALGWSDAIATSQARLTNSVKESLTSGVDVQALAAQLAPLLSTHQAHQFIVALGAALPKE